MIMDIKDFTEMIKRKRDRLDSMMRRKMPVMAEDLPILNLPKLGIAPEHYEAIEKAVKELERQGIAVVVEKEWFQFCH